MANTLTTTLYEMELDGIRWNQMELDGIVWNCMELYEVDTMDDTVLANGQRDEPPGDQQLV